MAAPALESSKPETTPQLCVYCQQRQAMTRDHVVARCFFSTLPANMLTVPSCGPCNTGTGDGVKRPMSADEEYTRTVMCMAASSAGPHPVIDALTDGPIARQFARRPALAVEFVKSMKTGWAQAPAGLVIPNQSTVTVDANRIVRVMTKITKGLYYHHAKTPLPLTQMVKVQLNLPANEFYELKELMLKCSNTGMKGYPGGEFVYLSARSTSRPELSLWLMAFYKRFIVFAVTPGVRDKQLVFGEADTGKPIIGIQL